MSNISEGIVLKLFDLSIVIVGAFLAYFFGIKKLLKERELSRQENKLARQENELFRKIELYRQLIKDLVILPDIGNYEQEKKEELKNRLNNHAWELLQFAPDHIYREYMQMLSKIKKGEPAMPVYEFMITLRKELIPETKLKADELGELERIG